MRHFFRPLLILVCCLASSCSHRPDAPASHVPDDWYVCSKSPLAYCPKGFKLPGTDAEGAPLAEFIYLADRRTRFYIPPRSILHRQQALAARSESLKHSPEIKPARDTHVPARHKKRFSVVETARLVYRIPLTAVMVFFGIAGGFLNDDDSAAGWSSALEKLWSR